MASDWSVYLTDHNGVRLADLSENYGFEFSRVVNSVGSFNVNLGQGFDDTLLAKDYRIEVWRDFGGDARLLFTGLIQRWFLESMDDLIIEGKCINTLLDRRVIVPEWLGAPKHCFAGEYDIGDAAGRIWRSIDNGFTWDSVLSVASASVLEGFAANQWGQPVAGLTVLGNTQIYVSGDGGANWTNTATLNGTCYGISKAANGNLVALTVDGTDEGRLYTSTDHGQTWALTQTTLYNSRSAIATDGTYVYAAGTFYNSIFTQVGTEVWRSADGVSWTRVLYYATTADEGASAVVCANNGDVIIGTWKVLGAFAATRYSTDQGSTWSARAVLPGGDSGQILYCGVTLSSNSVMMGCYRGTLYRSTDNGHTFAERYDFDPVGNAVAIYGLQETKDNALLATVTDGDIYRSTDEGSNWTSVESQGGSYMEGLLGNYS